MVHIALTLGLALLAQDGVSRIPNDPIVAGSVGAELDRALANLERRGFSGVALVAKDGVILLSKGYGLADRERGVPNRPSTVISTGSITKQFTAAAILLLEARGGLSVEDRIDEYFEDVPEDKREITLHHLLTHSAGFRSDFAGDFDPVGRDEYVKRTLRSTLLFAPGSSYSYSNAGYSLLGAIIEQITGVDYERFVREQLFIPAGMQDTGYVIPDWGDRVAKGYVDGREWGTVAGRLPKTGPYWALRANGGIHSTTLDMYRWHLALQSDEILSDAAKAKLFAPHVRTSRGSRSHYGYGWSVDTTARNTKLVHHGGSNDIYYATFRRYLDEDAVIYAASNGEMSIIDVQPYLTAILFGADYELPPPIIDLDEERLASYAGSWADADGNAVFVRATQAGLTASSAVPEISRRLLATAKRYDSRITPAVAKAQAAMFEAAEGEFTALYEAIGAEAPMEEFERREAARFATWAKELGELNGIRSFGGGIEFGWPCTVTQLDFDRGSRFVCARWVRGRIDDIRILAEPPSVELFPESPTAFSSYDLRTEHTMRLEFELDKGRPVALKLPGDAQAMYRK